MSELQHVRNAITSIEKIRELRRKLVETEDKLLHALMIKEIKLDAFKHGPVRVNVRRVTPGVIEWVLTMGNAEEFVLPLEEVDIRLWPRHFVRLLETDRSHYNSKYGRLYRKLRTIAGLRREHG